MTLPTANLTPNARAVLDRRYLLKDDAGQPIESAEDMFLRVAGDIGSAEAFWGEDPDPWIDSFYRAMVSLDFLPN